MTNPPKSKLFAPPEILAEFHRDYKSPTDEQRSELVMIISQANHFRKLARNVEVRMIAMTTIMQMIDVLSGGTRFAVIPANKVLSNALGLGSASHIPRYLRTVTDATGIRFYAITDHQRKFTVCHLPADFRATLEEASHTVEAAVTQCMHACEAAKQTIPTTRAVLDSRSNGPRPKRQSKRYASHQMPRLAIERIYSDPRWLRIYLNYGASPVLEIDSLQEEGLDERLKREWEPTSTSWLKQVKYTAEGKPIFDDLSQAALAGWTWWQMAKWRHQRGISYGEIPMGRLLGGIKALSKRFPGNRTEQVHWIACMLTYWTEIQFLVGRLADNLIPDEITLTHGAITPQIDTIARLSERECEEYLSELRNRMERSKQKVTFY